MHAILTAKNIKLQRGRTLLLRDSHLTLARKQMVYLSGASGSGKSSLLWALARMLPLQQGQLHLNNQAAEQISLTHWRTQVALLPQNAIMLSGDVRDNLLYPQVHIRAQQHPQRDLPDTATLQTLLNRLGLNAITLDQAAQQLSGGQQARLALARLYLTQPQVILADEPFANLDTDNVQRVHTLLRDFCHAGGSVLFTAHQPQNHDVCWHLDGTGQLSQSTYSA